MKKITSIVIILLLFGASTQVVNSKTSENINSQYRILSYQHDGYCLLKGYVSRYMDKGDWAYDAYALLDGSMSPIGFGCIGWVYSPSTSGTKIVSVTRTTYTHEVTARHAGTLQEQALGWPINSFSINATNIYWFSSGI